MPSISLPHVLTAVAAVFVLTQCSPPPSEMTLEEPRKVADVEPKSVASKKPVRTEAAPPDPCAHLLARAKPPAGAMVSVFRDRACAQDGRVDVSSSAALPSGVSGAVSSLIVWPERWVVFYAAEADLSASPFQNNGEALWVRGPCRIADLSLERRPQGGTWNDVIRAVRIVPPGGTIDTDTAKTWVSSCAS